MIAAAAIETESELRVLVVDDNEDFAANLSEILESEGARVQSASNVAAAKKLVEADTHDVAFVDLRLPDGSGEEVLAALGKHQPDCLAVVLTGNATIQSAIMAVEQGAFAYLLKDMPVEAVLAAFRKARERRHLEQQKAELEHRLRHQEQLAVIGQMAAILAHEIRNPLTGIRQAIEVILEATGEPPGMEGIKDSMLDRLRRLNELVNDLLQFARPVTVERRRTAIRELVESVAAEMRADGSLDGVEFEIAIDPAAADWRLDPQHFRLVLRNLFENAGHAMEKSPRKLLGIAAAVEGGGLRLEVRDRGTGIAPKNLDQIFKPFFTTRTRGTGLGLALAARIVNQHGGSISAANAADGGAVFTIRLPN